MSASITFSQSHIPEFWNSMRVGVIDDSDVLKDRSLDLLLDYGIDLIYDSLNVLLNIEKQD